MQRTPEERSDIDVRSARWVLASEQASRAQILVDRGIPRALASPLAYRILWRLSFPVRSPLHGPIQQIFLVYFLCCLVVSLPICVGSSLGPELLFGDGEWQRPCVIGLVQALLTSLVCGLAMAGVFRMVKRRVDVIGLEARTFE